MVPGRRIPRAAACCCLTLLLLFACLRLAAVLWVPHQQADRPKIHSSPPPPATYSEHGSRTSVHQANSSAKSEGSILLRLPRSSPPRAEIRHDRLQAHRVRPTTTTREPRAVRRIFDYPVVKKCTVHHERDFRALPVLVLEPGKPTGKEFHALKCDVPCLYSGDDHLYHRTADVSKSHAPSDFDCPHQHVVSFTMENIALAEKPERTYVMNVSLASDVPTPYYSWSDFSLQQARTSIPKHDNNPVLATAFVSNCVPQRRALIEALIAEGVGVDSFGACLHTKDEAAVSRVPGKYARKLDIMSRYKFHLAFENSIAEDYVSEKFFQALVAGTVPVVYGAPNIRDYAPANNSILVVADYPSAAQLAKRMKELAADPGAYRSLMAWREDGPSKNFVATMDFTTVHSECRLCIKAADDYARAHGHRDESIDPRLPAHLRLPNPSLSPRTHGGALLRLLVRERNRFYFRPVFLRVLTIAALHHGIIDAFTATNHVPVFARRRHFNGTLELFSVYRAYVTARQARDSARILLDDHVRALTNNSRLEVVFV